MTIYVKLIEINYLILPIEFFLFNGNDKPVLLLFVIKINTSKSPQTLTFCLHCVNFILKNKSAHNGDENQIQQNIYYQPGR